MKLSIAVDQYVARKRTDGFAFSNEESQKKQIRGAFGQYLSPAVVEQLANDPSQLKLGGVQLSAASARFELERSALSVEPITAQAYGAQLEATVEVDANAAPRIAAKGSINEVDLRKLLADVAREPWLEGRGALTWDLASEGASVGTLRHSLAGSVNASARSGALSGIDLRAALIEGRAELGKHAPAQPREFNAGANTTFNELKARFELREGRANGQVLEMNAATIRGSCRAQRSRRALFPLRRASSGFS